MFQDGYCTTNQHGHGTKILVQNWRCGFWRMILPWTPDEATMGFSKHMATGNHGEIMGKWRENHETSDFLGNQKTASFFAVLYFRMVYECRLIPLWNGFESGNADSTKQLRSFWAEDLTNTKISQRRTIVLWVYHEFDFGKERKGCTLKVFFKRNQQFMDIQIQICYNSSKKTVRIVFYHVLPFVMGM